MTEQEKPNEIQQMGIAMAQALKVISNLSAPVAQWAEALRVLNAINQKLLATSTESKD